MSPVARLGAAFATLTVFVWTLTPRPTVAAHEAGPTAETLVAASRAAYDGERWDEALEPTRTLVERFPHQHLYVERLANIYHQLNRPADEAAAWERVLTTAPTLENVCPAIGEAYQKAGDAPAAIDAFKRCLDRDPRDSEFMYHLARAYQRTGQVPAAERVYREALVIEPSHADAAVALATLRLRASAPGDALALVEPLLRRFPRNADMLLVAGLSYHRLNRRADARHAIARGLEIQDAYADLHIAMGIIDFDDGRVRDARGHFERVVALEPSRRAEVQVWLDRTRDVS